MGKQSARLYYRGNDHKDIYFQGNYHNAIAKGHETVWYKLYDNYCITLTGEVIDIENKKVVLTGITDAMQCENGTIMGIKDVDIEKIYGSVGAVFWEKIASINTEGYFLHQYYRQRCPRNSIVYEKSVDNVLYLKILRFDGISIIEKDVEIALESNYEEIPFYTDKHFSNNSDYYYVYEETDLSYIVYIVLEDGSVNKVTYQKRADTKYYEINYSPIIYAHDTNKAYILRTEVQIDYSVYPQSYAYLYSIDSNGIISKEGIGYSGYGFLSSKYNVLTIKDINAFMIHLYGKLDAPALISGNDYGGGKHSVSINDTTLPLYNKDGDRMGIDAVINYGDSDVTYCGIVTTLHPDVDKYSFIYQYSDGKGNYGNIVVFKDLGFAIQLTNDTE